MSISLNGDGIISGVSSITVGAGASVFSPAANTLALGTNGSERFRVTSTGQLQATSASDVRLTLGSSGTAGTNDSNHIRGDGTSLKFMNASGGATLFENNGTERFRITNDGVTFNGDTAAENALDDYEEGTWTPSLAGTATYLIQIGTYTKIGNLVTLKFTINVNTIGSGNNDLITGLPFTANSGLCAGSVGRLKSAGANWVSCSLYVTSDTIVISSKQAAGTDDTQSGLIFGNSTRMDGSVTYFV